MGCVRGNLAYPGWPSSPSTQQARGRLDGTRDSTVGAHQKMTLITRHILFLLVVTACLLPLSRLTADEPKLELVLQTGHTGSINSVAISGNRLRALTGGDDNVAILWDIQSGAKLRTFRHSKPVTSVAISHDGRWVLTGSMNKSAILWDAETGTISRTFAGHTGAECRVALSADGKRALTGSDDKTAILWDAKTGAKLRIFTGHTDGINSVALSGDGQIVVTGSADKTVIVWNAEAGTKLRSLQEHSARITSLALSSDSQLLVTGSGDRTAVLWDRKTGTKLRTFRGHKFGINSVAMSGDGRQVVTASALERTVILWDAQTGTRIHVFDEDPRSFLGSSVAFSGDALWLLTGSWRGGAVLWDTRTGEKLRTFHGLTSEVNSARLSKAGHWAVTGSSDGAAVVWDVGGGRKLHTLVGHTGSIESVALDEKNRRVVTGSRDSTVIFWDAQSGAKLRTFSGQMHPANPVPTRSGLQVLSPETMRMIEGMVCAVAMSADTQVLLAGLFDRKAILWDTQTGTVLRLFQGHTDPVTSAALSGDARYVLTGSLDKRAILWDAQTGGRLRTFSGHTDPVTSVALSSDGRRVLTGSEDARAILWDAQTGTRLRTFSGHKDTVKSVALGSDGRLVLTGSEDGRAILWDAQTGNRLRIFSGHTGSVNSAVLSEDGRRILTCSGDGTARLWDADSAKELCSLVSIDSGKEWLVVSPEGLFDGSINATRFVSYRLTGTLEFVPLERYQQKYWQPDLLAMLMKGERPVPKVNIAKSLPPRVRFAGSMRSGLEVPTSKLTIEAVAETRGDYPVKTFRLLVDGNPYGGQLGIHKVESPRTGKSSATWSIELEPGRHTLKVLADTEYVQGASEEIEIRYLGGNRDPDVELPSLYVLAIGISKYPGTRRLDYAALDASAVVQAYQQHSKSLYKAIDVKVVADEQADRKGIFAGVRWLREKMTSRSIGVVFLAGHGEKDKDGSLYFLPVDFEEKDLAGSSIDADTLKKQLAAIQGRKMLILDTCHAGQIDSGKKRGVGSLTDQLVRDLTAEENGLIVMCSALGSEEAKESHEFRHGLFTAAFLEALGGKANRSRDGAIYLTALDAYVAERVKVLSKGQQNPVTGKPTTVRDFPVSKP